jgi:hypothetical protein
MIKRYYSMFNCNQKYHSYKQIWSINYGFKDLISNMSRSNLRTPWPIHFKFHRVIGIDSLMVCILFGEISIFHSRVMGLYSSNCTIFIQLKTTFFEKSVKTINSNNSMKFEVNWWRVSQFTERHTKNRLQFDE